MPYFQRKPIGELADRVGVTIPGTPSRGALASVPNAVAGAMPTSAKAVTDIVRQATAILTSERRGVQARGAQPRYATRATPDTGSPVDTLQRQINGLIEQIAAIVAQPAAAIEPTNSPEPPAGFARVLTSSQPVPPGHPAIIRLSLVNEDEETAEIDFVATDLIGEPGARICADRVSFEPHRVTLGPGHSQPIEVQVLVPADTPESRYTGLIRASLLDYLHAVIVVEVKRSPR